MHKGAKGRIDLIEIRGEHLKDYLCARRRGLLVATFRYRREVSSNKPLFELAPSWDDCGGHWEGQIAEIDAGGGEYGSKVALLEMGRTDVDRDADVPVMGFPSDGSTWSTHHEFARLGPKQYVVIGEMWRNEWVPPGRRSPRLREGSEVSSVEFIVDSNGERVEAPELVGPISRWLWFSPAVVNEFLSRRSTELSWYTEDTAGLKMPLGTTIHFGINQIDLINVYAKDIAQLSVLWQKVWAAWNVAPDGKVAPELLASQMECRPAETIRAGKFVRGRS